MLMSVLSIIIPTRHLPEILQTCLEHLAKQTIAKDLEVIVVHDGTDDETTREIVMKKATTHYPLLTTHYFAIPKSQQGVARNRGVEKATAPLTLFIGDDIFLAPDACEQHVRVHEGFASKLVSRSSKLHAVLGTVSWDPAVGITPAMRWLDKTGWQFGYRFLKHYQSNFIPAHLQARFTYTSFISLPTSIAREYPFREDVSLYGWEDILWGEELAKNGVRLFYEPQAKALHHHKITLEDSLKRMETIGKSLRQMQTIDPTFERIPMGWKLLLHRVVALLPTIRGKHERAFIGGLTK